MAGASSFKSRTQKVRDPECSLQQKMLHRFADLRQAQAKEVLAFCENRLQFMQSDCERKRRRYDSSFSLCRGRRSERSLT